MVAHLQAQALLEIDVDREVLLEQHGGQRDRVVRAHGAVRPHLEDQALVVRRASHSSRLDTVIDAPHRRVDGVDRDPADPQGLVEVLVGAHITTGLLHQSLQLEAAFLVESGDQTVLATAGDLHLRVGDELISGDDLRPRDVEADDLRLVTMELKRNLLQIQEDVGDVFDHAGDRRELVKHTFDVQGRDGRSFDRRQQTATQSVAHGRREAALEGLCRELTVGLGQRDLFNFYPLRALESLPKHTIHSFVVSKASYLKERSR